MEIEVYVLLTAARAFLKGNEELEDSLWNILTFRPKWARMKELNMPTWIEAFREVKDMRCENLYLQSGRWNGVQSIGAIQRFGGWWFFRNYSMRTGRTSCWFTYKYLIASFNEKQMSLSDLSAL